ncbi:MAG: hydroxyacid dehydrogenase [Candidatus Hydrogenedentes bacterium]|nr:hydroxyacid dehydrogenase [Candidatus Hydrogenedentota bacterium]
MTTMNAAVLLTREMQAHCFAETDLARIAAVTGLRPAPGDALDDGAQLAAIQGAEIIITGWGTRPLTAEMLDAAPDLKFMFHSAGSIKHLVSGEFTARGIRACSARTALATGVAEFAFGEMLVSMKCGWQLAAATQQGQWDRAAVQDRICEPYGATVGLVGASCVGREMIRLCQTLELGALLLYDPYVSDADAAELGVEKVDLPELMGRSDVVSLHSPATEECRHLINAENLALLRDGAIFINTARGMCVDEAALIAELEAGRIFACLDVTDPEPPEAGSPLYALPNCILTPHIAGSVKQNALRQGRLVADQIEAFVRGDAPYDEIDLSLLDRTA